MSKTSHTLKALSARRKSLTSQLQSGITTESVQIVGVLIAPTDRVYTLTRHLYDGMINLALLTRGCVLAIDIQDGLVMATVELQIAKHRCSGNLFLELTQLSGTRFPIHQHEKLV